MTTTRPTSSTLPATPTPGPAGTEPADTERRRRGLKPPRISNSIPSLSKASQRGTGSLRPTAAKGGAILASAGKPATPVAPNPLPSPSLSPTIKSPSTIAAPVHSVTVNTSIPRSSLKPSPTGAAPIFSVSSHHSQQTFRSSSTSSQAKTPALKLPDTTGEAAQPIRQFGKAVATDIGTEAGKQLAAKGVTQLVKPGTPSLSKATSKGTAQGVQKTIKNEVPRDSVATGPHTQQGESTASAAENPAPDQTVAKPARQPGQAKPPLDVQDFTRQSARQYLKSQFDLDIDPGRYFLVEFEPSQDTPGLTADLRQRSAGDIKRQISLLDLMAEGYGKAASEDMAPAHGRYGIFSEQQIKGGGLITADQQALAAMPDRFAPFSPVPAADMFSEMSHSVLNPKLLIDNMSRAPEQGGYSVQQAFSDYLSKNEEKVVTSAADSRKLDAIEAGRVAANAGTISQDEKATFYRGLENGSGIARDGKDLDVSPLNLGKHVSSNALRIEWDDRVVYYLPGEERPLRSFDSDQSAWDEWFGPMLATAEQGEGFLARQFPGTGFGYREFRDQFDQTFEFGEDTLSEEIRDKDPMRYLVELRLEDMKNEIGASYDRGLRGWD